MDRSSKNPADKIPVDSFSCRICKKAVSKKIATVDDYDFYRCSNCHFIFCPSIDGAFLSKLYESGYHNSQHGAPEEGWAETKHLKPALELIKPRSAVLDFGCGESKLPDKLRKNGYDVTGIDIAPPVRKQTNRLTGNILEMDLPGNHFDLIYSIQVFEHIPEPLPFLHELLRLTKPGGYLYIHTDMEVPERFEDGFENWWYVSPPDHCAFYRHRTFKTVLKGTHHDLIFKDQKVVVIKKEN